MRLVIDASAALDACLAPPAFERLVAHELIAPPLLPSELLAGLRGLHYRGEISAQLADVARDTAKRLPVSLERRDDHQDAAWALAVRLGWAKTYDAEYVALAVALGVPLLTLDARLARGIGKEVEVIQPAAL